MMRIAETLGFTKTMPFAHNALPFAPSPSPNVYGRENPHWIWKRPSLALIIFPRNPWMFGADIDEGTPPNEEFDLAMVCSVFGPIRLSYITMTYE